MTKHISTANTHSSHYARAFTLTFGLLRYSFFLGYCPFAPTLKNLIVCFSYRIMTYVMYTIDTYCLVSSMGRTHVITLDW